jgi:putative membrane protein
MKLLIHWLLSAIAVMITAYILPGIVVKTFLVALVVAVVLGFLNSVIKPLLIILTLPIEIVTLGLFTFVINAGLVIITGSIVPGFFVQSFWWAMLFSLILAIVNAVLHHFEPHGHSHKHEQE